MQALTKTQFSLAEIPEEINRLHETMKHSASEVQRISESAVMDAINCGKLLARAKQLVGHGNWLAWLQTNCPELSVRTASRYMLLSARWNGNQIAGGLNRAYRELGIIKPTERTPRAASSITTVDAVLDNLASAIGRVDAILTGDVIQALPVDNRARLKAELEPLAKIYASL